MGKEIKSIDSYGVYATTVKITYIMIMSTSSQNPVVSHSLPSSQHSLGYSS